MKYSILIVALLIFKSSNAFSQQQLLPGTELQELAKIADVYAYSPNLAFSMYYTYADSLTWQTFIDSSWVDCKLSNGRIFITSNDVEMLWGKEYTVYVDKTDSLVMARPVADNKTILQIPLLDPAFREAHVDSMYTYTANDSFRIMRITFKPESVYLEYTLEYDPRTGLVYRVNYHSRNDNSLYPIPPDHIVCATVSMWVYDASPIDPAIFNEYRYIYKLNGALFLQPAWAQYHLQN